MAVERAQLEVRLVKLQEEANDRLQVALISSQREDAASARLVGAATDLIDAATRVGQGKTEFLEEVRLAFHRFWLISTTQEAQYAGRLLVRISYRIRDDILKNENEYPHPSSEIRSYVFKFVVAVRGELGTEGEAMPEID